MIPGIQKYIDDKLIAVQSHPKYPELVIYNYTNVCQYAGAWDEVTTKCRGLIFNTKTGEQLSNPLPKFFNYEERIAKGMGIPASTPYIAPKFDGWCGILYWHDGLPFIATRGSFDSIGARFANEWMYEHIALGTLDPEYTYVFEIIHPDTKIVVDYDFEGLVLLAKRHTKTGKELLWHPGMVPTLKRTPPSYRGGQMGDEMMYAGMTEATLADLPSLKEKHLYDHDGKKQVEEGFVIFFPEDNLRMKVKFEEYVRLHKIMTGLSAIGIWEALASGQELSIENVPDEFFDWFTKTKQGLIDQFNQIKLEAEVSLGNLKPGMTRKEQAEIVRLNPHAGVVFAMLDGKPWEKIVWKMIRPKGAQTYKVDTN